jgi:Zn ribbon nucleic-acid-binding protein
MAKASGYTCPQCSQHNPFSVWIFAHMDIEAAHKCGCGARNTILRGRLIESVPAKQEETTS